MTPGGKDIITQPHNKNKFLYYRMLKKVIGIIKNRKIS